MEGKSENDKVEKSDKAPEMENGDEEGAEEGVAEAYGEDYDYSVSTDLSCLYLSALRGSSRDSEFESISSSSSETDSRRTKWEKALRMKWMSVTGKRPPNLPHIVVLGEEGKGELMSFFGERRPLMIENRRRENWMKLRMRRAMSRGYVNAGKILREIRLPQIFYGLRCLRISPGFETMVATFGNGVVQVRQADSGEVLLTLKTLDALYGVEVLAARYHPKNSERVYVGGGCGVIHVFDVNNPKCIGTVREKHNEINNLDFSPDGSILVSVGKDGSVYLYDAHRLRLVSMQSKPSPDETTVEKELSYHHKRIYGLKYHPRDANIFVTGGWDCTVKVWDTRVCGAVNSIHGPRICGDSIDLRRHEILTGSWSATNSLKLWDLSSGRVMRNIEAANRSSPVDGEFIYVTKFFDGIPSTSAIIVGGNGTEEVEVINIDNNMVVASFPAMKAVTALDSFKNMIIYGGMESVLRIGDVNDHRRRTRLQSMRK